MLFTGAGTALANSGEEFYGIGYTAVVLGDGTGRFVSSFNEAVASGFGKIVGADLNADGKVDMVDANGVRYGRGDGTLGDWQAFSTGPLGHKVAVYDFNGDGRLDIAATNNSLDGISGFIRLNNGNGTFQPAQSYVSGPNPEELAVADFNGDGKIDLVTVNAGSASSLTVCLGNGNGTFQGPLSFATSPGDGKAGGMALADFNGDGWMDVTVRAWNYPAYGHNLRVLLNDGNWSAPLPNITIGDVAVTEGNTGTRAAQITVTLSAASNQMVTLAYATASGTATAGSDFRAASGILTIPAGQISGTITVMVLGDRLGEQKETFFVNLTNATNATIADGQGAGEIVDDEPRISISDVTKAEGKKGQTTSFIFTVTLSAAYDQAVTMSFRTADGAAKTSDSDYVAKTGTLTLAPGEITKTITIVVKGDSKKESEETFYLDLFGNSSNSLVAKKRGLGKILNDD